MVTHVAAYFNMCMWAAGEGREGKEIGNKMFSSPFLKCLCSLRIYTRRLHETIFPDFVRETFPNSSNTNRKINKKQLTKERV